MIRALGILAAAIACALGAYFLILLSVVFAGPVATIGALLGLTLFAAWQGRTRRTYHGPALDTAVLQAVADETDRQGRDAARISGEVFDWYERLHKPDDHVTPGRERLPQ